MPEYVQRDDDAVKETSGKLTLGKVVLFSEDCATTQKEVYPVGKQAYSVLLSVVRVWRQVAVNTRLH